MEYERDSPYMEGGGRRLYAQSGDQGRGVSATSKQAGSGDELGDVWVRENGACGDICEQYEQTRGFSLGVRQQIYRAEDMCACWAGLQYVAVGLRLLHGMAMRHHMSRGIRELVLHTLRPAYGGGSLRHEQH
jgi:hypothetical protein